MMEKEELKKKISKKHSIRSCLLLPHLSILLIALVLVGGFPLYSSIKNSKLVLKELEEHMVEHVNEEILQSLAIAEQLNQINHDMFKAGNLKLESQVEREVYFSNILKSYPRVAMTFVGLEDGSFYGARRNLDGNNFVVRNDDSTGGGSYYFSTDEIGVGKKLQEKHEDFDPRTRPWYKLAVETERVIYSPVYMHFVFQEPTITASSPIYDDNGQLVGVFGVNYLLSWMDDLLTNLLIGENGIIYVVDQEDNLISTSIDMDDYRLEDDESSLININEINNEYINKSKDTYKESESNKANTIKINGEKYYVNREDINYKNINWQAYFLISENDFLKDIKIASLYTSLLLVLFIIISIGITFFIAEKISKPIEELSRAAERLSSGTYECITKERKILEIDSLTNSLNKSGKALATLVTNLEEQVLARTKELENKNKILKNFSYFDGLTGICNRRKFDEVYSKAWNSAMRLGYSIAIIMIDIDDFKKYNDSYGHIKGDECLKKIAQELKRKLRRSTDLLARYGGEEFIVLIEGIEEENLKILAENLRKAIVNLKIDHESSEYKYVTISLGYSYFSPTIGIEKNVLIEIADKNLYKAKLIGKNQVSGS